MEEGEGARGRVDGLLMGGEMFVRCDGRAEIKHLLETGPLKSPV